MSTPDPRAPLLSGFSQYDVDFVIPRVGIPTYPSVSTLSCFTRVEDPEYPEIYTANC